MPPPTTPPPTTPPPPSGAGKAAPCIDITMPSPSLVQVANATGHRTFSLAFVLGDSTGCNPSWGGTIPLNDTRIINDIRALRVQGDDFGMDPYSIQVLQSAAARGVNVLVHPMTMEFGSSRANWGDAVIAAAESSLRQLRQIWPTRTDAQLKRMLGVTPMIGRNFNGKIFTQAHARQLVTWATNNHIGLLAFWSAGLDNGGCPGGGVSATCSSISQSTFEFTNILKGFRG